MLRLGTELHPCQGNRTTPIIIDVGVHQAGDAIGVETIRLWFMKLLIPGVVYSKGIGRGGAPNCYVIHGNFVPSSFFDFLPLSGGPAIYHC